MNSLESILDSNSLFAGFSSMELTDLAGNAIHKEYQDQEILVYQEDVWPYLFLIIEGNINVVKESAEGRSFFAT